MPLDIGGAAGPVDESECIAAARAGDADAFRRLVDLYRDRVYNFLLRMVKHHEEAEDLAQEVFVRVWRHLGDYDMRWAFRTWLFCIARNLALNALRTPRAVILSIETGFEDGHEPLQIADSAATPSQQALSREQRRRLAEAVEAMPPRLAMLFTLFYQEEMSIAEIAQVTGMTAGAVKVALYRIRETLKERFRGEA
ncbi:MAG: sigma-70 family RNA polymerase sigma factor [Candidatus Sumerlaeia bacterium]|nr:sigma-70 family RNA polymerase sigma factor [Candidatus Sumerlaeia bacterium]